ncbi:C-type lectin protein [Aspergillus granulosus]|uniref:C-type lectin protein n=1 Tax=Aspergillus granulosus TaxID=176169 RepID=A0ABR4HNS3_9EURO
MSPLALSPERVDIVDIRENDLGISLVHEIQKGLNPSNGTRRSMPTMLLYDSEGLKLFEKITFLEEYYLTNAEIEVLETHSRNLVERIPRNAQLLELGSGNLRKIEILLREFERVEKPVDYYALDLSLSELERTFDNVRAEDYNSVGLHGLHGTYDDAVSWLSDPENRKRPTVVLSMGSSLGNFNASDGAAFLARFTELLGPSDMMIIGLDACEDSAKVYKAYNDSAGVTRKFYENGLANANQVLGGEVFRSGEWEVLTEYDDIEGCHKAFYVPTKDVTIDGVHIKQGERLIFEEAYKYSPAKREKLWHDAGLIEGAKFSSSSGDYHLHLLHSAAFQLLTSPSQYAASPIPSPEEFQSLWVAWDIATKAMIPQEELLSKPIKLRNSLIFYLGHIPTFSDIHLTRALRGKPTTPKSYQLIFERGIDPDVDDPQKCHSHSEIPDEWPSRSDILDYQDRVRNRLRSVLKLPGLAQDRTLGEALWIGFEHEAMHLETFLYMLIQSERILPPPGVATPDFKQMFLDARGKQKQNEWFAIPEQTLSIGLESSENTMPAVSFGWDNEMPLRTITVRPFEAQARGITNGEYAEYLQAVQVSKYPVSWIETGRAEDFLAKFAVRTVFGPVPLEFAQDWPVIASYDELNQYAQWMQCRLPTFEEAKSIYAHSAQLKKHTPGGSANTSTDCYGPPETTEPKKYNGSNGYHKHHLQNGHVKGAQPVLPPTASSPPVFVDLADCNVGFKHWHPTPIIQNGDKLAGHGELGGVWEWTSTPIAEHDGFKAMEIYPGYTSDFFDGKHNVALGGSWATHPRIAGRTTFVNWYQRNYPYPWAGARLVRDV